MITKDEVFAEIQKARGGVADIYSRFSEMPEMIQAHFHLNRALVLRDGLPLSRLEREYLSVETSRANGCDYAVAHHTQAYESHLKEAKSPPDSRRLELLGELARVLTRTPLQAKNLKEKFLRAGFNETEWLHAIKVVSYFNFTNRLALALDLQLEQDFASTCK